MTRLRVLAVTAALALGCSARPTPPGSIDGAASSSASPTTAGPSGARTTLCSASPRKAQATSAGANIVRVLTSGLEAPAGEKRSAVCDVLSTRAGAAFDSATVERDLHELWKTGLIEDARVTRESAPGGIALTFELVPREAITKVTLAGAPSSIPSEILSALLPTAGLDDAARNWKVDAALASELRPFGYRHASATHRIDRDPATGATLTFTLEPGALTTVSDVKFTGLATLDAKKIAEGLMTKPGAPVSEDALDRDTLVITSAGYDAGLTDIRVDAPTVVESPDGAHATITWAVVEGPRYRVGKIVFDGDLRGTSDDYVKRASLPKSGDTFRRSDFVAGLTKITAFHAANGETVTLDPETQIDPKTHVISLKIHVSRAR